jgi:hypothetical protein
VKTAAFAMVVLLGLGLSACTPRPQARMVGVTGARVTEETTTVMVLVRIDNPTHDVLLLSGLDYEVEAHDWFTARGSYALSRVLGPGETQYVEIPLPVKSWEAALGAPGAALNGVAYRMDGTLRAWKGPGEKQWRVHQEGKIEPVAEVGPEIRNHARGKIVVNAHVGK